MVLSGDFWLVLFFVLHRLLSYSGQWLVWRIVSKWAFCSAGSLRFLWRTPLPAQGISVA